MFWQPGSFLANLTFHQSQAIETPEESPIAQAEPTVSGAAAFVLPISEPNYIPVLDTTVPRPITDARSLLAYDLRSGRNLIEKNPSAKLPIASLTKLMSAVVVLENIKLTDIATMGETAVRADGEKQDFFLNERQSIDSLFRAMLIGSSNDAAYAIANHAASYSIDFVEEMNIKAAEIGMKNSLFLDPAGLNDDAHSSVEDLVKLTRYAMRYDYIWQTMREGSVTIVSDDGASKHTFENTNQLLGVIPDVIGGKTGNTDGALGCMLLVVDVPGYYDKIITVVLGSNDRFGDTQKVIDWIKLAYSWE